MGAGKTAAARLLSSTVGQNGTPPIIIDADIEAKMLMNTDLRIRELLVKAFGSSIIKKNGISFGTLGRIAFSSREHLLRLNTIVHPPLVKYLRGLLEAQNDRRFILDAAVLPLWKIEPLFDVCLWVHAPFEMRLNRLIQTRGDLDEHPLRERMRIQEECLPAPRCPPWRMILNDGSLERLAEVVCIL